MWPFKAKVPAIPYEELVETYPPAPCEEQYKHYYWEELQGWPCPRCEKQREDKLALEKEQRFAKLIATEVVALLNTPTKE